MKKLTPGITRKTTISEPIPVEFTHDQLWEALRDCEDLLDRCAAPGFVVENTARDIVEDRNLSGDKITFALREVDLAESTRAMIRTLKPEARWTETEITYKFKDVPVIIKIIHNEYEMFRFLNKKPYLAGDYLYPNPWEKYWTARFIVQ